MGNLLIEIGPSSTEPHPPSAMGDPYSADLVERAERTVIRGRSVAEQKGSLAAAIVAVDRAHWMGELAGWLVFVLSSAGETGRHDAATSILDTLGYTPTLGIVALGTNNRLTLGNKSGPWRIEAKRGPYMYPCKIPREGKLFRAVAAAPASMGLPPPETLYSHGAFDAGFLEARSCEAAMWGPGRMKLFHSDEGYMLVEEPALAARDCCALIQSYLGR